MMQDFNNDNQNNNNQDVNASNIQTTKKNPLIILALIIIIVIVGISYFKQGNKNDDLNAKSATETEQKKDVQVVDNIKWGTQTGLMFRDKEKGLVNVLAHGYFSYETNDIEHKDQLEELAFSCVLTAFSTSFMNITDGLDDVITAISDYQKYFYNKKGKEEVLKAAKECFPDLKDVTLSNMSWIEY